MAEDNIPELSLLGWSTTEKFWVSPSGEIIPLEGLWHYQWALRHKAIHGVDLADEAEEQPVRLKMIAGGWWRMNYTRKTCSLVVEGDTSTGINEEVRKAVNKFISFNARLLNRVRINFLQDEVWVDSILIEPVSALDDGINPSHSADGSPPTS